MRFVINARVVKLPPLSPSRGKPQAFVPKGSSPPFLYQRLSTVRSQGSHAQEPQAIVSKASFYNSSFHKRKKITRISPMVWPYKQAYKQ